MPQIENQVIRVCTYVECQKRSVNCKQTRKKRDEVNSSIKSLVQKLSSKCFHKPSEYNKKYHEKTRMYTLRLYFQLLINE
jgi:hypothetical protein